MSEEPFVTDEVIAVHLSLSRKEVQRLTRAGTITGYPCSGKIRKRYRYRISEVSRDFARLCQRPRDRSSPSDSEPEKKNG